MCKIFIQYIIMNKLHVITHDIFYACKDEPHELNALCPDILSSIYKKKNHLLTNEDIMKEIKTLKSYTNALIALSDNRLELKKLLQDGDIKSAFNLIDIFAPKDIVSLYNMTTGLLRSEYISSYGYVIPTFPIVNFITEIIGNNLTLEIGSGLGLLSAFLQANGTNVIATDSNEWYDESIVDTFTEVEMINAIDAINKYETNYLIICWPPKDQPMANDALKVYKGDYLIYYGEDSDGCCADYYFFKTLEHEWEDFDSNFDNRNWNSFNDEVSIYKRKFI